jgi:hypothetical protein
MSDSGNFKLGQSRTLFIMSQCRTLTSLNNFGPLEGSVFEFRSLSRVQNLEIQSVGPSPPINNPKWASTGPTCTQSRYRPPQMRSPSGDRAHDKEGAGAGRHRPTSVRRAYPGVDSSSEESSTHFTSSRPPAPLLHSSTSTISAHHHRPPPFSLITVQAREKVRRRHLFL